MTEAEEKAKATTTPRSKKVRRSRSDEKRIQEVRDLLAHTMTTWFCMQHHPNAYLRKTVEEDMKKAFIVLFREVMVRPGRRPPWALELGRAFRSSKPIRDRITEILNIYPWGDDLRLLLSGGSTGAD